MPSPQPLVPALAAPEPPSALPSFASPLSERDIARAATAALAAHVPLGQWLMSHGVPRADATLALATHYHCPFFHFDDRTPLPAQLRSQLRPEFLRELCAAPIGDDEEHLTVVMADPGDLEALDQLRALANKKQLLVRVGMPDEILSFIDAAYGSTGHVKEILVELSQDDERPLVEEDEAAGVDDADTAVIKLANQLIIDGVRSGASDIHVEPNGNDRSMSVRFRVDRDCVDYQQVPARFRRALVARLKIMAHLDIAERRKPQDGRIRFPMGSRRVELRVASYPTALGDEDLVLRILPDGKPLPLAEMHMSARDYAQLMALIARPYGLILCVGPTGSGKTTTLHSALAALNRTDLKICTAEDPVEITQPGLRQLQVQPRIGLTFATALRSFLRADPDVIMIGEMRDRETAQVAVEASLTGHLVLTTLHTNSAPETVTRLCDMGVDPYTFADSLLGVLAQRLATALCPACRERCEPDSQERKRLDELLRAHEMPGEGPLPWRARGCDHCRGSGYRGRIAIHELLVVDDALREAIGRRAPIEELRGIAVAGGMRTLLQDGLEKVQQGLVDLRQLLMVCSR